MSFITKDCGDVVENEWENGGEGSGNDLVPASNPCSCSVRFDDSTSLAVKDSSSTLSHTPRHTSHSTAEHSAWLRLREQRALSTELSHF